MSAQVYFLPGKTEGRGRGQAWIHPQNYLIMLTIIKVFMILFLLFMERENTLAVSKQISKLFLIMNVQVYIFLGQTEGEMKAFSGRG